MHDLIHRETVKGRYIFPRRSDKVEDFARQMSSMVKVLEEDKRSRTFIYRYRNTSPDHYRHALAYFESIVPYLPEAYDNPNQAEIERILLEQAIEKDKEYNPLTYGFGG